MPGLPSELLNLVRRTGTHGLGHTWATLALAAGIHPKVVQEVLGHASITMTLDTYSAVLPGLHDAATATVADAVFGDGPLVQSGNLRRPVAGAVGATGASRGDRCIGIGEPDR